MTMLSQLTRKLLFASLSGLLTLTSPAEKVELVAKTIVDEEALIFAQGPATRFGISANGRSHQQNPLISYRGYQYVTYFNAQREVCIGRRKLPLGDWKIIAFDDHRFETNDSHNTAVIGICDKDGTIHMAFDHHASQLNYRVSEIGAAHDPGSTPWERSLFGDKEHTLGGLVPAERVTYPRFIPAPNGNLMLYYRAVTSANGDGMIEEYDGGKHQWTPGLGKFIARDQGLFKAGGQTSQYRCPYMDSLSYAGTRLHASWVWRDRFLRTAQDNQHDICYAYSDDHGRTWYNSAGNLIGTTGRVPITLDSEGLTVAPIPINSGLSNQNTHFAFPDGSIHIMVIQHATDNRERRYHHHWRTAAGRWHSEVLPFSGTRPKLLANAEREMFLIYTSDDQLALAKGSPDPQGKRWKWEQLQLPATQFLAGDALPDPDRWRTEGLLSLYFQEEPEEMIRTNKDEAVDGDPSALIVADYRLTEDGK